MDITFLFHQDDWRGDKRKENLLRFLTEGVLLQEGFSMEILEGEQTLPLRRDKLCIAVFPIPEEESARLGIFRSRFTCWNAERLLKNYPTIIPKWVNGNSVCLVAIRTPQKCGKGLGRSFVQGGMRYRRFAQTFPILNGVSPWEGKTDHWWLEKLFDLYGVPPEIRPRPV